MWPAIISALVALLGSAGAIILSKRQERAAIWRAKKLAYYEEFFAAASGVVGDAAPSQAKIRFATAVNNLHLIGSAGVIKALHAVTDEIAESNANQGARDRHDQLWSMLVWQIRADLNDPPTKDPAAFQARLWASGVGKNV